MKNLLFVLALLSPAVDSGPVYMDASKARWLLDPKDGTIELCAPAQNGDDVCMTAPVGENCKSI